MKPVLVVVLVLVSHCAVAAAYGDEKANIAGTWKWRLAISKGREVDFTLTLKLDGDNLTGFLVGPDGKKVKIEDAIYKKGEVSFKLTGTRFGHKHTIKFTGNIKGDTIKGKEESEIDRIRHVRDWEAKRSKD
jgi:hypothetical protein